MSGSWLGGTWFGRALSRVDGLVAKVEDHEGRIASAIAVAEATLRRGRARHEQLVREHGELLRSRRGQLRRATQERALAVGASREEVAFTHLRRARRADARGVELAGHVERSTDLERLLDDELTRMHEHIATLRAQADYLGARRTRLTTTEGIEGEAGAWAEAQASFARWESQLASAESAAGLFAPQVESELMSDDAHDLRAELSALRQMTADEERR